MQLNRKKANTKGLVLPPGVRVERTPFNNSVLSQTCKLGHDPLWLSYCDYCQSLDLDVYLRY